ncbi:hypothetical protein GN244_ATG10261 [Phytophthora infestans]|uniref:Uncharacterized protein n=1 Tax=Phytophthora infestans TaxID=4787 RepID=A0A833S0Z1_PHYIN|nr:hypothetical protein GN244_ATG10261 [Phytophthora infestans]KAI9987987.1 hypothetical protein PInf_024247 [Phytophthora infestans]
MIVPTRFGLKYAPIPTLALEYEDDLKGVVDATGENSTSLYVYRDGNGTSLPARKLHVVELPMLTKTSETEQITRQLQQDNGRFLAPGVVSETQLKRLLDRLVQNLPDPTQMGTDETEKRQPSLTITREDCSVLKEEGSELEESTMEPSESVVEASQSDEHETLPPQAKAEKERSDNEAEDEIAGMEGYDASSDSDESPPIATEKEKEESEDEAEEDAKKKRALQSESDISEEEVQSEELEYFSEDGSDEDSF